MKNKEKRKEYRGKINGIFLVCGSSIAGPIVEMTINGLSYIHTQEPESNKIKSVIGAIIEKNSLLRNVPMKKVFELTRMVKGIPIIKTGIVFGKLTKKQHRCLKHLLLKKRLRQQVAKSSIKKLVQAT